MLKIPYSKNEYPYSMNSLKYLFLLALLCSFIAAKGQEQIGLSVENYSGISSVGLNPAWQTSNPLAWDLNLVEASQFVDNNYAYLTNTHLFHTLNNTDNIRVVFEEGTPREDEIVLDFFDTNRRKFVSVFTEVMGPSLSVRIRDYNQVGFFIKARTGVSAQRIPSELGYYAVERLDGDSIIVPQSHLSAMAWNEIGINFARKFDTYDGSFSIGTNIKFLTGYEAVYAKNNISFEGRKISGDTIAITNPDISFGATNSNFNIADGESFRRSRNGNGFGFDLGLTYIFEGNEDIYKLKLGASFIDIGNINFSRNTGDYLISFDSTQQLVSTDYEGIENPDTLLAELSRNIYNDASAIRKANSFRMGLPAAFSLQADYMVVPMFYINALFVQRLTNGNNIPLERGNLLAVTPRFEHRWGAASLPISLYNYQHLNIGLSLRFAFLTIGSDDLGSLIGKSNRFTGTDFYVGLKINPFDIGLNLGGGGGGKGNVKCYSF